MKSTGFLMNKRFPTSNKDQVISGESLKLAEKIINFDLVHHINTKEPTEVARNTLFTNNAVSPMIIRSPKEEQVEKVAAESQANEIQIKQEDAGNFTQ